MSSDEEARSTDRPPAGDEESDTHRDIASAVRRAKTNASPGRYGPPAATAKINKFDLAQALALTTADGEQIPSSSKPPRDDDAPFVGGEVEVIGEEEVNSGIPATESVPPSKSVKSEPAALETSAIKPKPSGNLPLVLLAVAVGMIVMGYVYVTTR